MSYGFETLAIHAGQEPDERTGAVIPPIFQTSTFKQDAVGSPRLGYEYARSGNPTLEGGAHGLTFASGLAAEDTLIRTVCAPGDHVIIPDDAYGGTFRLFAKVAQRWGLTWTAARISDADDVRSKGLADHGRPTHKLSRGVPEEPAPCSPGAADAWSGLSQRATAGPHRWFDGLCAWLDLPA